MVSAAIALAILHASMALSAGGFTYPMDDAYIHLQMADARAAGWFGVGPDHSAAASSSLAFPWLLAPLALTPWALYGPALLSAAGVLLLTAAAWRAAGLVVDSPPVRWCSAALLVLAAHGLTMGALGLEHGIQGALVAWAAVGLCETERDGHPPGWLPLVLGALPLVRYDCLGVFALSLAWLWWKGHRAPALAAVALAAAAGGAMTARMYLHTGHVLPNSVLSKASARSFAWQEPWQPALLIPLAIAAVASFRSRSSLALLALAAVLGHAAVGQVGLFFRYLAYLMPLAVILGAWSCRAELRAAWAGPGRRALVMAAALAALPALQTARYLPAASRHVAELHKGMRAVADAVGVVAVNDIGVVGWRSPSGAVDLMGLADNETLPFVLAGDAPETWMGAVAEERGARVAMVFDAWFPRVPSSWTRLGTLGVSQSAFEESHREVVLYAVNPAEARELREEVAAVRLPAGSILELN